MTNPFANFSQKDWLYVGGAVASIVALFLFAYTQQNVAAGNGTITDVNNDPLAVPPGGSDQGGASYINYNMGAYNAPPIASGTDVSPDNSNTSACGCNNDCAGPSPLATGNTAGNLAALLNYYTQTSPAYVAIQEAGLNRYFNAGQVYGP